MITKIGYSLAGYGQLSKAIVIHLYSYDLMQAVIKGFFSN